MERLFTLFPDITRSLAFYLSSVWASGEIFLYFSVPLFTSRLYVRRCFTLYIIPCNYGFQGWFSFSLYNWGDIYWENNSVLVSSSKSFDNMVFHLRLAVLHSSMTYWDIDEHRYCTYGNLFFVNTWHTSFVHIFSDNS